MAKLAVEPGGAHKLSHNLLGQRLGRKGRGTRERILAATGRLLDDAIERPISLSAVAREASLGMTTLYLYFGDLTELLLALLEPVMASAEASHVANLRERWGDGVLHEQCEAFVLAFHTFWKRNTRLLHLRNALADGGDERMRDHRRLSSYPLIKLFVIQMDGDPNITTSATIAMATVLLTGIERLVTVNTDAHIKSNMPVTHIENLLLAQARLLELGIRECREAAGQAGIGTDSGAARARQR